MSNLLQGQLIVDKIQATLKGILRSVNNNMFQISSLK